MPQHPDHESFEAFRKKRRGGSHNDDTPEPKERQSEAAESGEPFHIPEAVDMIQDLAESGELAERATVLSEGQTVRFNLDDYPELKDEQVGMPIVWIGAGIVTRVPKPEDLKGKDDGHAPMPFRKDLEVMQLETAVIHGRRIGFKKLKAQLARRGAKSPGGLAAFIGRKKFGKERFQRAAARGRTLQ